MNIDPETNVGLFIAVLTLPNLLAVYKRHPREEKPHADGQKRWTHPLALVALETFLPTATLREVLGLVGRQLTSGQLDGDCTLLADVTEGGDADLRLARELSLPITAVRATSALGGYDGSGGIHLIPLGDLVSGVRLTLQEKGLTISDGLPEAHAILAELGSLSEERLALSPRVRTVAVALWWAGRTGHSEFVSRRPTPGAEVSQWTRAWQARAAQERAERRQEAAQDEDDLFGARRWEFDPRLGR
jgi:hypothetical protein